MKKTFVVAVVLVAAMMLSVVSMAQDKALTLIPGDSVIVGEIDFPILNELMTKNKAMMAQAEIPGFVMSLIAKSKKAYFGMPASAMMGGEPEDFYAVVTGSLKTSDLVELAKVVAVKEGKKIRFEKANIAGLNAVKGIPEGNEGDEVFVADFPGGIVVGSEKGLAKFVAVKSGKLANASGNVDLIKVGKMIPASYGFKIYGVPGNTGGMQIDALAFGLGLNKDIMSILLSLRSTDPAALQQINQSVMMMKGMGAMMDETGKLAEVLEKMVVESKADGVDISLDIPMKVLEEIGKSMAAKAEGGM